MLAYQLGWMSLLMSWDQDERAGRKVITLAPGYKWNQLGGLYQSFYKQVEGLSLEELSCLYQARVQAFTNWVDTFSPEDLFSPVARLYPGQLAHLEMGAY